MKAFATSSYGYLCSSVNGHKHRGYFTHFNMASDLKFVSSTEFLVSKQSTALKELYQTLASSGVNLCVNAL